MVVLALKERQVHLDMGRGMRWQINEARAAEIVEQMVPFFGEAKYYEGFRTGFEQIIAANEEVSWEIAYFSLGEVRRDGELAQGRIATFEAVITGLEDDVAEVSSEGIDRASILLTEDLDPAVFFVESRLLFHVRIRDTEPLVLYLLDWEEVEGP